MRPPGRAHESIEAIRRVLAAREPAEVDAPDLLAAAVSLTLRESESGGLEMLFIKRAEYPGDPWSAQIAFPGGRMEPGDADLFETAVRETREELGIDLVSDGELIGRLDDLRPVSIRLPAIFVRPFVTLLHTGSGLTLSHEVAEAFWVPVEVLRDADCWGPATVNARGATFEVRACHFAGHVIWGMTERILSQFLRLSQ